MIHARALLLADGSSDEPLGTHVAAMARPHGVALDVVTPEFDRMEPTPGRQVRQRLARMMEIDPDFDILIVHRDAERRHPDDRVTEIQRALDSLGVAWPTVPVARIRMTEAWLLLDEAAIRAVAGWPTGTEPLELPVSGAAESVADPKAMLRHALCVASGLSGRRLKKFTRDFPAHRRALLERLDRAGSVRGLSAWQALERAVLDAMTRVVRATD